MRKPTGRALWLFVLIPACVLGLLGTGLVFLRAWNLTYPAVPWVHMWMVAADIDGQATIETECFSIAFEGESFGRGVSAGNPIVDGRYFHFALFSRTDISNTQKNGVTYSYSQDERTAGIEYKGHQIIYSHPLQKLEIDGKAFSTAGQYWHFVVKANSEIARQPRQPTLVTKYVAEYASQSR